MTILFNDDNSRRNTTHYVEQWRAGEVSAQSLYGAAHLEKYGIHVKYLSHKQPKPKNRKKLVLQDTLRILFKGGKYDAIFSQSYRGLELLMLLRALHLYHKPIFVWQHTVLTASKPTLSDRIKRFMLNGIDEMFFFNDRIAQEALQTGKVGRFKVVPFGGDVTFCDKIAAPTQPNSPLVFLSTGVENRDYQTLVNAFKGLNAKLVIYTYKRNGDKIYEDYLREVHEENIEIHLLDNPLPALDLLAISKQADCMLICTTPLPYKYPCGLTSLVEAMALGKPVITTANPYYGVDVEGEGIGYVMQHPEQWRNCIQKCIENPSSLTMMGKKAYHFAQSSYNIENTSSIIAQETLKRVQ